MIRCSALVTRDPLGQPVRCNRRSALALCAEHAGEEWIA